MGGVPAEDCRLAIGIDFRGISGKAGVLSIWAVNAPDDSALN
jgi:hypothetical protein